MAFPFETNIYCIIRLLQRHKRIGYEVYDTPSRKHYNHSDNAPKHMHPTLLPRLRAFTIYYHFNDAPNENYDTNTEEYPDYWSYYFRNQRLNGITKCHSIHVYKLLLNLRYAIITGIISPVPWTSGTNLWHRLTRRFCLKGCGQNINQTPN